MQRWFHWMYCKVFVQFHKRQTLGLLLKCHKISIVTTPPNIYVTNNDDRDRGETFETFRILFVRKISGNHTWVKSTWIISEDRQIAAVHPIKTAIKVVENTSSMWPGNLYKIDKSSLKRLPFRLWISNHLTFSYRRENEPIQWDVPCSGLEIFCVWGDFVELI